MSFESFKETGIFSKQAHVKIPEGLFEEEHARKGFFGRVSQLYHKNPCVNWKNIEGNLIPRSIPETFSHDMFRNTFISLLANKDAVISTGFFTETPLHFFRNADFDELFFVHKGKGKFETIYGHISYQTGDYISLPRGTTYKAFITEETKFLKIESSSEFEQPERGMLGPNALYDQSVLEVPKAELGSEQDLKEYIVEIKRLGEITKVTYPFNPLDAVGWKGSLYPYKLSIYDICPIMSHRYHIPPSGHTTFVCQNFVICSFVERPLEDTKHGVLKVPFYHSNIDYDEVLFYHKGEFFSRDGIDEGALTFHPQGIHHGPHPKAFKSANDKIYTNEYAVMIDTKYPLMPSQSFLALENKDYWKSWMDK